MNIITVGIDLAKNVFAVHGVNDSGKPALVKPKVSRADLLPLIANLPPCLIGMEACSGAHHWARQFRQHGHTVKLMAPKFVAPYRMTGKKGKNDAADAAAICEAVTRPNMLFVPVKEEHQQIILCLHRTRQGFVEERTASYNRLRGLIAEFGIVLPQKVTCLRREIGAHLEDLPGYANLCVGDLLSHTAELDAKIAEYDTRAAPKARDFTNQKGFRHKGLTERERGKNSRKSSVRAKVEHAFLIIKRLFGAASVSYRGMVKNGNRLFVVTALANLFMVRHHLLRLQQERCV